ncbi:MAG: sensor histidine kinase [Xanthomonadaceae bacterium]|nr:sensor histidine kinase [Xanthomonadaceae bacterium]
MNPGNRLMALHQRLLPAELGLGWLPYLWLIYYGFFFIEYIFRSPGPVESIAIIGTLIAFAVLYFSAYRRSGASAMGHIAVLALLAIAWAPFNAGSGVLFIYAASFAYRVGPPRIAFMVLAGVAATVAATAWLAHPVLVYWLPGALISVIIGTANIVFSEKERHNAELRLKQAEVKRLARVAERERIARDLHDVLGHTLSLITVKSELAAKLLEVDSARARAELQAIEQTARTALKEVRATISGLHEQGLNEALEQVAVSLRAADVALELERDPDIVPPLQVQAMLALILREAVTNILRHAGARRCRIVIAKEGKGMRLEITDDGQGGLKAEGSGVQGMRARIESLGGELQLKSGSGTQIIARLPEAALLP